MKRDVRTTRKNEQLLSYPDKGGAQFLSVAIMLYAQSSAYFEAFDKKGGTDQAMLKKAIALRN